MVKEKAEISNISQIEKGNKIDFKKPKVKLDFLGKLTHLGMQH